MTSFEPHFGHLFVHFILVEGLRRQTTQAQRSDHEAHRLGSERNAAVRRSALLDVLLRGTLPASNPACNLLQDLAVEDRENCPEEPLISYDRAPSVFSSHAENEMRTL